MGSTGGGVGSNQYQTRGVARPPAVAAFGVNLLDQVMADVPVPVPRSCLLPNEAPVLELPEIDHGAAMRQVMASRHLANTVLTGETHDLDRNAVLAMAQTADEDFCHVLIRSHGDDEELLQVVLDRKDPTLDRIVAGLNKLAPDVYRRLYGRGPAVDKVLLQKGACPKDVVAAALNSRDQSVVRVARLHPAAVSLMESVDHLDKANLLNTKCRADTLRQAARAGQHLDLVVAHRNCPPDILSGLYQSNPELATPIAFHPRCPPDVLSDYWDGKATPKERVGLLRSRNLPEKYWRAELDAVVSGPPNKSAASESLINRRDLSEGDVRSLAGHCYSIDLFRNPASPSDIIEAAYKGCPFDYAPVALRHRNCTEQFLRESLGAVAGQGNGYEKHVQAIVNNPNMSAAALVDVVREHTSLYAPGSRSREVLRSKLPAHVAAMFDIGI